TAAVTLLTDGKSRNSPGLWSNAGDRIAYTSTRRNGRDTDLYIVDPGRPTSNRMVAQLDGSGWKALDWSPGDREILVQETISINERYLWVFDANGGPKSLVTPKGSTEKTFYGHGHFSKDGKGIYVLTDRESEFRRLAFL